MFGRGSARPELINDINAARTATVGIMVVLGKVM
jgi:hypothetical protein